MHSASAKIDGEPYALRGARTVRGEALGNLPSTAEQGALRLLHESIEEIEVHGTAELRTERLKLRRYRQEDAEELYKYFGTDPSTYQYSGWNPYATPEMTMETIARFLRSYNDDHCYGWVMDVDDVIAGTIGAYDYK